MALCPDGLSSGPCPRVRPDGYCEAKPEMRCVWDDPAMVGGPRRLNGHLLRWAPLALTVACLAGGFYAATAVTEESLSNLEERVARNEAGAEPHRFRLREIERAQTRIETTVEERTSAIQTQLDRVLDKLDEMSHP